MWPHLCGNGAANGEATTGRNLRANLRGPSDEAHLSDCCLESRLDPMNYNEWAQHQRWAQHQARLRSMKALVDTQAPSTIKYTRTAKNNKKSAMERRTRAKAIQKDNDMLVQRITSIVERRPQQPDNRNHTRVHDHFAFIHDQARKAQQKEISRENKRVLKRLVEHSQRSEYKQSDMALPPKPTKRRLPVLVSLPKYSPPVAPAPRVSRDPAAAVYSAPAVDEPHRKASTRASATAPLAKHAPAGASLPQLGHAALQRALPPDPGPGSSSMSDQSHGQSHSRNHGSLYRRQHGHDRPNVAAGNDMTSAPIKPKPKRRRKRARKSAGKAGAGADPEAVTTSVGDGVELSTMAKGGAVGVASGPTAVPRKRLDKDKRARQQQQHAAACAQAKARNARKLEAQPPALSRSRTWVDPRFVDEPRLAADAG